MTPIIEKTVGAVAVLASSAIGAASGFLSSAAVHLDAQTQVPLGVAVTVGVSVCGTLISLAWWLSAKFRGIEDSIKALNSRLQHLRCARNGECEFPDLVP